MKLQVIHRTDYTYAAPVIESFNEVRLQPLSSDGQTCLSFVLKVLPAGKLSHYYDFYRNCVHFFEVTEPHSTLSIESTSKVTTSPPPITADAAPAPMKRLGECLYLEECYDYVHDSHYVPLSPEVWRLALDAAGGVDDVWQAAQTVMRFIHNNFAYVPNSTTVSTVIYEVLSHRRGVCQDFTHVMLGMCRSLKIPARYVSGYIYNGPEGHLLGAQASHAWCEVYLPGIGWRALDPTNNQLADERYVKVAVGRDYGDIIPVKGSYKGTRDKTMKITVQVTHLEV